MILVYAESDIIPNPYRPPYPRAEWLHITTMITILSVLSARNIRGERRLRSGDESGVNPRSPSAAMSAVSYSLDQAARLVIRLPSVRPCDQPHPFSYTESDSSSDAEKDWSGDRVRADVAKAARIIVLTISVGCLD
jgi:hypothetical protein